MSLPRAFAASRRRRHLVARLAALIAATSAFAPGAADATEVGVTAGPYLSFTFGDEIGVGWGVESTILVAPGTRTCARGIGDDNWGIGPHLALGAVNLSRLRLVGALAAGGALEDEDSIALLGEAGLALHVGGEGTDAGIHTGFIVQSPAYVRGFARAEWLLQEYSVGAAVGFPNLINTEPECVVGRPLRGADGALAPTAVVRHQADIAHPACDEGTAIARAWIDDAQAEAASVPAFLQLAAELLAHDAPGDLVARALDAAEDEVLHAALCARAATRIGGRRVVPVIPAAPLRAPLAGADGLTRIAIESWLDGCVSEGAAAARAGWAAASAVDRVSASVQRRIARDESRHAALGLGVLRWALRQGGAPVAVASLRDVAPAAADGPDTSVEAVTFGRTPRHVAERLHERHVVEARRALERELVHRAAA
jgi:hypothetical protein